MEDRMTFHLSEHKGLTSKAKDWKVVYTEEINSKTEAIRLEKKIKKEEQKGF
jgi:putative endonuclease